MRSFVTTLLIAGAAMLVVQLTGCSRRPDISECFGGTNNVQLIAKPESVTAFRTAAWLKGTRHYSREDIWRKEGAGVAVPSTEAVHLSKLLLNKRSYEFYPGTRKDGIAEPSVVISFSRGNANVDVFFSFADNTLLVKTDRLTPVGRPLWAGGDFDPIRAELVRIVKSIFASDQRMQALSETRANGSLWPDTSRPE